MPTILLPQLSDRLLVVLDTETTGLYCDSGDEVIELAAEKIVNGEVVDEFHRLIRPTRPIPPEVTAIHGLYDEFVHANGHWAEEVFPAFTDFISDAVLVGHNIRRFDWPFLVAHYNRLGLTVPSNELLDTLELSRSLLKLPNHRLGTIATHFQIATDGAHRAAADVAMTRQILLRLLQSSGA